jgi:TolB-like protein/Tfp pilus assembly protein PilF
MKIDNFFSELKRRNVYKIAVAYAIVGWLLVQVATQVFPFFEIPNWAVRLIVLVIVIGFPIALLLAWAFELTPEGLKRTEDVDVAPQKRRKSHAWIYVVAVGAVLSIGLFFLGRYSTGNDAASRSAFEELRRGKQSEAVTGSSIPQKSIAVLPFENLSDDKNAAYFADGIQDEILTKLASIADLKVISRTSTAKYKSKPEDLKTVSQQLGVATVLEGSVQKAADKVRVNVQLIDARADSHLWAKTYDRDIKDVFAVESEVAQEIADSLQAKLSPAEANTLANAPTKDPAAHDLFLKGEHEERLAESSLKAESYDQAAAWYRQAIARDPNFALAMARLVENRMDRHWYFEQLSEAELAQVRSMAEHALALAPDLAEAHVALGDFYYHGYRQYEQALAEFERALQLQPNASTALAYLGYVHRRQGQWERCLNELKKALAQDPRNATLAANLPSTYVLLRMWKETERGARHALEIDPHSADGMRMLLDSIVSGSGDISEAQRALATFPAENKTLVSSNFGDVRNIMGDRAYVFVLARDFNAALKVWEAPGNAAFEERRQLSARVAIRILAGDLIGAQAEAEKARRLLGERLRERPNDISSMTKLSWVYLALKRNSDALKLARQAADLLPPEKDAIIGNILLTGLAEIEARTGATADAIAILRLLLSVPAGGSVSIARLKIDPVWDPIRNDPAFQQLLALKEQVGPNK